MNTDRPPRRLMPLDGQEGPALPISAAGIDALAQAILQRASEGPTLAARTLVSRPIRPWQVALGLAIVTGSAAAALRWLPSAVEAPPAKPLEPQPSSHGADTPRPGSATETVSPSPSVAEPGDNILGTGGAAPRASSEPRTGRAMPTPKPEPSAPDEAARGADDPALLLGRANELRRGQQWSAAAATYEEVVRRFPSSAEAYGARVATASLYLEKLNQPARARHFFQQASRSGGLREEALWGLARAHRAMGDATQERSTLERLVADHPDALRARHARARLDELGPGAL